MTHEPPGIPPAKGTPDNTPDAAPDDTFGDTFDDTPNFSPNETIGHGSGHDSLGGGDSTQKSAVVVVVDRLSAGYLGCYGNTWLETPEINRMASESLLFEFATTDSPRLLDVYGSYWWGAPADGSDLDGPTPPPRLETSIPGQLRQAGVHTCLVTDDEQVAGAAPAEAWDRMVLLRSEETGEEAADISQTRIAQTFAAALEALESLVPPYLLWVHLRGMEAPWDAPYAFRHSLIEEDDPEPPPFTDPPRTHLPPSEDPDVRWGLMRAYAGQVLALDLCSGPFWEALNSLPHDDQRLVLWTSPRGYPLGEHMAVGTSDSGLYGETMHVPWWIRVPGTDSAGARCMSLVHPPDLAATLVDWWGLDAESHSNVLRRGTSLLSVAESPDDTGRPYVVCSDGRQLALRCQDWLATLPPGETWQLFVKPDDRFEANEVADRCREIVEQLGPWGERYRESVAQQFAHFPLLPEPLREKTG
jgi:arylsulfatase A-like enzyme